MTTNVPPTPDAVREVLREIPDPEVGIDIVSLGLVRDIGVDGGTVTVRMTMTSPACPMTDQIERRVKAVVAYRCSGVTGVELEWVWNPPWTPDWMSDDARQMLGWDD